jgi:hypothetical protein
VDLRAPFTGTLLLPDRGFLERVTPVQLADGRTVAGVGWRFWSERFEVLDESGAVLAQCQPRGAFRVRYSVTTTDGRLVVDLVIGGWTRSYDDAQATLPGGRLLSVRRPSTWTQRRFEVQGARGMVGRIEPASSVWFGRFSSYAFEIFDGALSVLEAVSLAQAIRVHVRRRRRRA